MFGTITRRFNALEPGDHFAEILTGSVWAFGARICATGLTLAVTALIARSYGPDALGTLAVIDSVLKLVTIFTVFGTHIAILRLIPEHLARYSPASAFRVYRKTQLFVVSVSLVSGGLLVACSGVIAESVFGKPDLEPYFGFMAGVVVFGSLMQLNTNAVRGLSLIRGFAFMQLVPGLSNLILLVLLTLVNANQDVPVFALFASIAITALVGEGIVDRVFRRRSSASDALHPIAISRVLRISAPMLMTALMTFVIGQTGILMLGVLRPEEAVGHYAVAVQLAATAAVMLQALNTMATPNYSKLFYSGKTDELMRVARKTSKLVFWVSLPVMVGLICFGEYVITLFYGRPFVVAYTPMIFLLIGKFVYAISGSTGGFMNMTGNHKPLLVIKASAALMNVLLNLFLIPVYGLNGAAVSAMVSLIFWNVAVLIYIKNKFGRTIGYLPF